MTRAELIGLIIGAINDLLTGVSVEDLGEQTILFGRSGIFDSLGLVGLITEVEAQVNEKCGTSLFVASDRAMSQQSSPFRTVGTLADYLGELITEAAASGSIGARA
jgi:acyl carrier protein